MPTAAPATDRRAALRAWLASAAPAVAEVVAAATARATDAGRPLAAEDVIAAAVRTSVVPAGLDADAIDECLNGAATPFPLHALADAADTRAAGWKQPTDVRAVLAAAVDRLPESTRVELAEIELTADALAPPRSPAAELGFGSDLVPDCGACPVVGRAAELRAVLAGLYARRFVVLVAPPGVGKTALAAAVAYHLARRTPGVVPAELHGWRVLKVTRLDLLGGTAARGRLEKRVKKLFAFLRANPNVVLFLDELHTILDTKDDAGAVLANAVKGEIGLAGMPVLGATTPPEFIKHLESDDALASRLQKVRLAPPDAAETDRILATALARHLPPTPTAARLVVSAEARAAAVRITDRYQRHRHQPRKALAALLDAAGDVLYQLGTGSRTNPNITAEDVAAAFAAATHLPLAEFDPNPAERSARLRTFLEARVYCQPEAIDAVVSHLAESDAGRTDPTRPRGVFVLAGPIGVGKTLFLRGLADHMKGQGAGVIAVPAGATAGEGGAAVLVGAPPGYIGHENPTVHARVLEQPFTVITLDNFDRPGRAAVDALRDILSGRGTDAAGREADFSAGIIVASVRTPPAATEADARAVLSAGPWADLLPLVDRVIPFRPFDRAALGELLAARIDDRRRRGVPLPAALDRPATRRALVSAALDPAGSARGVDAALDDYLRQANSRP